MWSLGCVMYTMLFSRTPFENPREGLSQLAIMSARYSFPALKPTASATATASTSASSVDVIEFIPLITLCLQSKSNDRLSLEDLKAVLRGEKEVPIESGKDDVSKSSLDFADFKSAFDSSSIMLEKSYSDVNDSSVMLETDCNDGDSDFGDFVMADDVTVPHNSSPRPSNGDFVHR